MLHSMLLKYYLLHYFSVVCYHDGVLYLFVSSRNFYTVIQLVEKLNFDSSCDFLSTRVRYKTYLVAA